MSERVQQSLDSLFARLASLRTPDVDGVYQAEQLDTDPTQTSIPNAKFCIRCKRPKHTEEFFFGKGSYAKTWHATVKAFRQAAEEGCRRCALISNTIKTCTDGAADLVDESVWVDARPLSYHDDRYNVEGEPVRVSIRIMGRSGGEFELFSIEKIYLGLLSEANANARQGDENLSKGSIQKTPFRIMTKEIYPDDPICEGAIHHARTWVNECVRNHKLCASMPVPSLPKRVLELRDSKVYLRENLGTRSQARYACLSHCWGPQGPTIKLTSCTEEVLVGGVAIDELPKTFAEAAKVCLKLDIAYLWIDALCIRQDDAADWKEAAATMASIYERAFVTIAALCGKGSKDGLRPLVKDRFQVRKLQHVDLHVRSRHFEFPPNFNSNDTVSEGVWPLLSRAWVYQERRLSPRIIYFSAYQLVWECRSARRSQDGTCDQQWDHGAEGGATPTLRKFGVDMKDPVDAWQKAVVEYARLNLTYESDRLPAIAALAEQMIQIRKTDVYLAGMWKDSLLSDLGWDTGFFKARPIPDTYTPTWSWASRQGGVRYRLRPPHIVPSVRLMNLAYTLAGPSHIGDVRDAIITLKGPIVNVTAGAEPLSPVNPFKINNVSSPFTENIIITTSADFEFAEAGVPLMPGEIFKAFILYDGDLRMKWRSEGFGIILRKVSNDNYRRVGAVVITPQRTKRGKKARHDEASQKLMDDFIASLSVEEIDII
ncbi:Nn.00g039640.m01.CDS01 [Neocucurbitaria sp. VM-36]